MFSVVIGSRADRACTEGEDKFYHLCKSVAREHSLEIYDLDYLKGNSTIRVYIVNPRTDTATIDDCVLINRSLGVAWEKEDWLPSSITLEISSPGIHRRLSRRCHFVKALGKDIAIIVKDGVEWAKKGEKFIGNVLAVKEKEIQLKCKEQTVSLPWQMIKKANLKEEGKI